MSTPVSIVQGQMEALLRRVAREQESLSRRARDSADDQARSIIARAREEARARSRQAAEDAHQSIERSLADRRAALDTAARQREQALLRGLLDEGWKMLPAALATVWENAETRRRWCLAACDIARRTALADTAAVVEFDPASPADVDNHVERRMSQHAVRCSVRRVDTLGPGLRIRLAMACVDATIPGLLASRERVEAELLAELDVLLAEPVGVAA
jgi:hypothetical protein